MCTRRPSHLRPLTLRSIPTHLPTLPSLLQHVTMGTARVVSWGQVVGCKQTKGSGATAYIFVLGSAVNDWTLTMSSLIRVCRSRRSVMCSSRSTLQARSIASSNRRPKKRPSRRATAHTHTQREREMHTQRKDAERSAAGLYPFQLRPPIETKAMTTHRQSKIQAPCCRAGTPASAGKYQGGVRGEGWAG